MAESQGNETNTAGTVERGRYDHAALETRWRARWKQSGLHASDIDPSRPKFYALTMLPYPSGDLHIGHWYAMTPPDTRARYKRMRGYNVLFPMGFDAFGLPAENAAIKHGVHPRDWTYRNIERMRGQLDSMGAMFDWRREAVSSDPEFYRWTQWFFVRLFEQGLAYKKFSPVDFCPHCNTTLAREQVWGEDRHCERCDTPVVKRHLDQWFFRITRYADELLDFSGLDWPERVRTLQTNWIGRSQGAEVRFALTEAPAGAEATTQAITVFTTRPDTLWGVSFLALAPEHPLVARLTTPEQRAQVDAYTAQATRQTDIQRESTEREKTGVFTGGYVLNPVDGRRVPVWVADYVLMTYGTGAVMGVPAHDARDFEFARVFGLPVLQVIAPVEAVAEATPELPYEGPGRMVNSGALDGTLVPADLAKVVAWLEQLGCGRAAVTYRLRDWLISRQRFWGAPIPIVSCDTCGQVPVPEDQLPVLLPDDVEWKPTGESPLKLHPTWRHTTCPRCGGPGTRDTDTMDTFMCSSWYHYRYLSPRYDAAPWDPAEAAYWLPVDSYTGGVEHATMHLIYTRFFTKALRDMGLVAFGEPMLQLRNQGIILGEDSEKMSKSRGNVVAPDDLVARYGADAVRAYLLFFARWELGGPWSARGIEGTSRWLNRVYNLVVGTPAAAAEAGDADATRTLRRATHQTIRRVTDDFEQFQFNTLVAALMEYTNALGKLRAQAGTPAWDEAITALIKLLAPIAPHLAEELWARRGGTTSVHLQAWPECDAAAAAEDTLTLVVQVNGKVRERLSLPADVSEADAKAQALATEAVRKRVAEVGAPKQVVYVKGRLVNVVF
jgi:leucyl-tRNA synthetase